MSLVGVTPLTSLNETSVPVYQASAGATNMDKLSTIQYKEFREAHQNECCWICRIRAAIEAHHILGRRKGHGNLLMCVCRDCHNRIAKSAKRKGVALRYMLKFRPHLTSLVTRLAPWAVKEKAKDCDQCREPKTKRTECYNCGWFVCKICWDTHNELCSPGSLL